jgi:hypothetical protein
MPKREFIDGRGRILGRVNVIDLAFVFALILFLVLGGHYLSRLNALLAPNPPPTTVVFRAQMPESIWDGLSVGDSIIDGNGDGTSKIMEKTLLSVRDGMADGVIVADMALKRLTNGRMAFDNTVVIAGNGLILRTKSVQFSGVIDSLGDSSMRPHKRRESVDLVLKGVDNWEARSIRVGAKESIGGETIAIIKDERVSASKIAAFADDGTVLVRDDPLRSDLELTVELTVVEYMGSTTYQGQELAPGGEIAIGAGDFRIRGRIKSIR